MGSTITKDALGTEKKSQIPLVSDSIREETANPIKGTETEGVVKAGQTEMVL